MINRQMDDAVTAFRNGETIDLMGFSAGYVHGYRAGYIMGMTYGTLPNPELESEQTSAIAREITAGANDGLEDAVVDRESDERLQQITFA